MWSQIMTKARMTCQQYLNWLDIVANHMHGRFHSRAYGCLTGNSSQYPRENVPACHYSVLRLQPKLVVRRGKTLIDRKVTGVVSTQRVAWDQHLPLLCLSSQPPAVADPLDCYSGDLNCAMFCFERAPKVFTQTYHSALLPHAYASRWH